MHLCDYQNDAMTFRLTSADKRYSILGLSGEVGELHSLFAKAIRDNDGNVDVQSVKKELGDILWFVAAIATDFGFGLSEIAQMNLEKLNSRKNRNKIQGSGDDR